MTPASFPARRWLPPRPWAGLLALAVVLGAGLRLDQFSGQVLIDDEWHAVHQVLRRDPAAMLLDFGFSDYSIPLGIYDWMLAHTVGLSEVAMRAPMLACGIATLLLFPLYVARRLPWPVAVVFALLLALSPLLILYSRMARPYAITLLLAWIAHAAFQRYLAAAPGARGAGFTYGTAAAMSAWLHPVIAPFVVAPLLWGLARLRQVPTPQRRLEFIRLLQLALPTSAVMALLLLPPLLANPSSMSLKSGVDTVDAGTFIGVWYTWLGTSSGMVVLLCLALATLGAGSVWRALPVARTGLLGLALTSLALVLTRPTWSYMPLSVGRYLLPFLPLLLLAVAAGSIALARRVAAVPTLPRRVAGVVVALLPAVALALHSPLPDFLRRPNGHSLHLVHHLDFRPHANPYVADMAGIPLSPFWATLAVQPRGSLQLAAGPFYFESFDWDAPRWEHLSGQAVLPAFVTGLCVGQRWGEVPAESRFRFRNAVHLAEGARLAARGIDYVVWQKPYWRPRQGQAVPIGGDTAYCERELLTMFGPPTYEDDLLLVFRVSAPGARTDATR